MPSFVLVTVVSHTTSTGLLQSSTNRLALEFLCYSTWSWLDQLCATRHDVGGGIPGTWFPSVPGWYWSRGPRFARGRLRKRCFAKIVHCKSKSTTRPPIVTSKKAWGIATSRQLGASVVVGQSFLRSVVQMRSKGPQFHGPHETVNGNEVNEKEETLIWDIVDECWRPSADYELIVKAESEARGLQKIAQNVVNGTSPADSDDQLMRDFMEEVVGGGSTGSPMMFSPGDEDHEGLLVSPLDQGGAAVDQEPLTKTQINKQKRQRYREQQKLKKQAGVYNKKKEITAVYVSNLPVGISVAELVETFKKCGALQLDPITKEPLVKLYRKSSGEARGDALVTFQRKEAVENAVLRYHEAPVGGGASSSSGRTSTSVITVQKAEFGAKDSATQQSAGGPAHSAEELRKLITERAERGEIALDPNEQAAKAAEGRRRARKLEREKFHQSVLQEDGLTGSGVVSGGVVRGSAGANRDGGGRRGRSPGDRKKNNIVLRNLFDRAFIKSQGRDEKGYIEELRQDLLEDYFEWNPQARADADAAARLSFQDQLLPPTLSSPGTPRGSARFRNFSSSPGGSEEGSSPERELNQPNSLLLVRENSPELRANPVAGAPQRPPQQRGGGEKGLSDNSSSHGGGMAGGQKGVEKGGSSAAAPPVKIYAFLGAEDRGFVIVQFNDSSEAEMYRAHKHNSRFDGRLVHADFHDGVDLKKSRKRKRAEETSLGGEDGGKRARRAAADGGAATTAQKVDGTTTDVVEGGLDGSNAMDVDDAGGKRVEVGENGFAHVATEDDWLNAGSDDDSDDDDLEIRNADD